MIRRIYAVLIAAVLAGVWAAAQGTSTCQAVISFDGTNIAASRDPISCKSGEDLTITFDNRSSGPRQFVISDINCKDNSGVGNDPTDGFVHNEKDVPGMTTKDLKKGFLGLSRPNVRSSSDVKALHCGPNAMPNYLYKYTIRVGDPGTGAHAKSLDPDIEVPNP